MGYKVKKITLIRDCGASYLREVFLLSSDFELPTIAGEYQKFISKDDIKKGTIKAINQSLFNKVGLLRIAEVAEDNSILFIELQASFWLNKIIIENDHIVTDIYYIEGNKLLYSFLNVSGSRPVSLTLQKENDSGIVYNKIKSNETDPLYRQFFIKKACNQITNDEMKNIITPELMTVKEVAKYLQMAVKTIQNWTSGKNIPVEYAGRLPRYRKTSIDKWLKSKS